MPKHLPLALQEHPHPFPAKPTGITSHARVCAAGAGDANPCGKMYGAMAEPPPRAALALSAGPLLVSMSLHSPVKPIAAQCLGCSVASLRDDRIVHGSVPRSNLLPLAGYALPLPRAAGRGAAEGSAHWTLPRGKAPGSLPQAKLRAP